MFENRYNHQNDFSFNKSRNFMKAFQIPNLPYPLHWLNQPDSWDLSAEGQLTITAPATSDWFIDPRGAVNVRNAPVLLFPTSGPCMLSAQVTANHAATYDAGVLMVYENPLAWAKFCLELSPQGLATMVSVVTKGVSDDCNAFAVNGSVYMRVSRLEQAYAFHVSEDGIRWDLIRYFKLEDHQNAQLGFEAQSPTGSGCTVSFRDIRFEPRLLADIRSGE
jgi:regulation of enolase protein 1 (concanavalin A-like superfamily)